MSNIPHKDFSEAELMTAISLSNMEAGNGKKSGKSNHNHSYTNVNSNQNHHHHDTHDDDNTVEDRSATGPDEGGEGKRKIKFKRAKKLHRAASALYAKQMKDLQASRFQVTLNRN